MKTYKIHTRIKARGEEAMPLCKSNNKKPMYVAKGKTLDDYKPEDRCGNCERIKRT